MKNETLTGSDVLDNSLKGADIDESTLTSIGGGGPAGGDLTGTYPNPQIRGNAVTSSKILDGNVLNADLGSFSVTADKISSRSVGASQLALPEGWHYIGDAGEPAFQNGWSNYDAGSHDGAVWQHAAYSGRRTSAARSLLPYLGLLRPAACDSRYVAGRNAATAVPWLTARRRGAPPRRRGGAGRRERYSLTL